MSLSLVYWRGLCGLVFLDIPLYLLYLPLNILAPFIIWQLKKLQYSWVDL
ncbi:MAG: hypothetical protein MET45_27340 [Nostoc sp. LLA-1]|nr:hypothetical protein [Cyanocohniella sp. LLY]